MRFAALFALSLAPLGQAGSADYFVPAHRVSGIGVARDDISQELLGVRTDRMIQTQTFSIMREKEAVAGAHRITTSAKLQSLFRQAESQTGVPASVIEAIAYLESWGDPNAQSPAGPKGIMQISGATARSMGLRVSMATRYRVTKDRVLVSGKGKKARYKTITHRTPYVVTLRCTWGAFSLYPMLILGRTISWRTATALFGSVMLLGIAAGYGVNPARPLT